MGGFLACGNLAVGLRSQASELDGIVGSGGFSSIPHSEAEGIGSPGCRRCLGRICPDGALSGIGSRPAPVQPDVSADRGSLRPLLTAGRPRNGHHLGFVEEAA
jgi:hypothetical protein